MDKLSSSSSIKKRKGGAEKVRDKKRKSLEAEALKCRKLTDIGLKLGEGVAGANSSGPGQLSGASSSSVSDIPSTSFDKPSEQLSEPQKSSTVRDSEQIGDVAVEAIQMIQLDQPPEFVSTGISSLYWI